MAAVKVSENVYWVGAIDWDVREFHGYKVPFGTTYNAYLVLDDKITLIDTVKAKFADQMLNNIKEIVDPSRIKCVIANHAEPDHSGSLPLIADIAKDAVIYTSPNGVKPLTAYYKRNFPFKTVKTGESLNTGKYNFDFILTPMVHWPDNMVTYLKEEKILFSNDAFGQHQATEERFDDELGEERMLARARDYYANIVLPYGPQVKKALDGISGFETRIIAPSHGAVWRRYLSGVLSKYETWTANKTDEKQAVIIYDTMWGTTKDMAIRIADDFAEQGIRSHMLPLTEFHVSECMDMLMEAKIIAVGSPTLNKNVMPRVAGFLAYMTGLAPKNRIGLAFGSYGWGGESVGIVEAALKNCGFEMLPSRKAVYKL